MAMDLRRIRGFLLPSADGGDGRFREDMRRLHHLGLRAIGGTEIAVAVFVFIAQRITDVALAGQSGAARVLTAGRAWQSALVILVGLATLAVARTRAGQKHAAGLLCFSAWLSSAVLIGASLVFTPHASDEYISVHITTVMLAAITVAPLRPLETFLLGLSIWVSYLAAFMAGALWSLLDWNAWDPSHLAFLLMLTLLSTGLAAVLYAQRAANDRAHQDSLRLAQDLSTAPLRALLSENAISVGKLAAALTHELNTPLGALKSAIDTMVVLAAKQATAPPEAQPRLVAMQSELRHAVNNCMERLKSVIARLQRFIDLHHTERQEANLNDMLGDVAMLLRPSLQNNVQLEFDLQPLPPLCCRPQQISSVLSSLLSNAINALDTDGRITVSTRKMQSLVRVRIEDNGRGMDDVELETIFDPGFKVTGGRVSTGNWSLFSSRQIVFEHGGEIQISSMPGKGTTVDVLLPI